MLRFSRCTGNDLMTFSVDRMELASRTTCSAGGTEGGAYAATAAAYRTPVLRFASVMHFGVNRHEPDFRLLTYTGGAM